MPLLLKPIKSTEILLDYFSPLPNFQFNYVLGEDGIENWVGIFCSGSVPSSYLSLEILGGYGGNPDGLGRVGWFNSQGIYMNSQLFKIPKDIKVLSFKTYSTDPTNKVMKILLTKIKGNQGEV